MNIIRMLILFLVFILLNVYLFIRGWQALPGITVHIVYSVIFSLLSTSVFIAVFLGNRLPLWLSHILEALGGYWIILFVFIIAGAIFGDLMRIVDHFTGFFPSWVTANYQKAKVLYLIFVLLFLGLISLIGYWRFSHPRITPLEVNINASTYNKETLNVVAVSDIHLGHLIRKKRFSKWVDLINNQQADIILLAGDIFDHNMKTVKNQGMHNELSRLKAKYGVYAIPGNHEYYAGIDEAIDYLKKSGVRILRDEMVNVDNRLVVVGRDDVTNRKRKSLTSILNGQNGELPKIVLDHQPVSFTESVENHIHLHISGHTHNGQIFPFNLIVSKIYSLGYGYRKEGSTHFYVSSGLGLWGAMLRFGTVSEIVKIRILVN